MSKVCTGPKCDRPVKSHGLCSGHWSQRVRGKPLTVIRRGGTSFAAWRKLPEYQDLPAWCGTAGGYSNRECRCVLCTVAWNAYCQGKKKRPRDPQQPIELNESIEHGTLTAYWYGCRCTACRASRSEYIMEYRYNEKIDIQLQLRKQNYRCKVCAKDISSTCVVDHDHRTGHFRGLLCHGCNTGIGKLGDSIEGLKSALAYLESVEA